MNQKLNVIITGVTGMVGEGVLNECLYNDNVEQILVINRKPCGVAHPKLKEILHNDFFNLSSIENELRKYNACFFCLGVSSVGMKEPEYFRLTYTLTMHVATTLAKLNKDMSFCYISGSGTDSSEKGKLMWARVKGKTENDLQQLGFASVYNFRPAILQPTKGLKNTLKLYTYFGWLMPLVKLITPNYICSLQQLAKAMIQVSTKGYTKNIIEVKDIIALSK